MVYSNNEKKLSALTEATSPAFSNCVMKAINGESKLIVNDETGETLKSQRFFVRDFSVDNGTISLIGDQPSEVFVWETERFMLLQGNSDPFMFELKDTQQDSSYITLIFDRSLHK